MTSLHINNAPFGFGKQEPHLLVNSDKGSAGVDMGAHHIPAADGEGKQPALPVFNFNFVNDNSGLVFKHMDSLSARTLGGVPASCAQTPNGSLTVGGAA